MSSKNNPIYKIGDRVKHIKDTVYGTILEIGGSSLTYRYTIRWEDEQTSTERITSIEFGWHPLEIFKELLIK